MCAKSDGSCKHITFDKEIDPTSYWRELSPRDPLRDSGAIKPNAIGLNVSRSLHSLTATPSSLPRKSDTITQDLEFVELGFRTIEDKMSFKEAYDTLRRLAELDGFRRQNRPLLTEETLPSNYQSPSEQSSLTRKYESAAGDAGNMIPTVALEGTNTKTTPFHRAKAVRPPLRRSHALVASRLDSIIELDNRKRSSNVSHDRQRESTRPSIEGESRQISLLHEPTLNEYIRPEEDSGITPVLSTQSHLPEYSPPKHLESTAAAAESLRNSGRSDISEPHTIGALASGFSSDSLEIDVAIKDGDPNLRLLNKSPRSKSLKCPFHFLDCEETFHKDRKREWVRHSLTHFKTHEAHGYAGLVKRVEPPKSFCCYFCKTEFSRLSGTDCWNDYMKHIHRCGLGYKWIPPDITLIEYLWQENIISDDTYRWLRFERPPFIFEYNLPKVSAPQEFEQRSSFVWETSGDEEQGFGSEKQVNSKIQRASIETSAKRESYRGLRSEHPLFSIPEHNLPKVSAPQEFEQRSSFVWETSGDEEQDFGFEKQVNRKNTANEHRNVHQAGAMAASHLPKDCRLCVVEKGAGRLYT